MQTAALSRRLRNSIVAKGRRRQAPRQRVASHNTHSCWRRQALRAGHRGPHHRRAPARTSLCALPSLTSAGCAWTDITASASSSPRTARVLRTPTQPRARYAPTQCTSHAGSRGRLGLTLRVEAEAASWRQAASCSASLARGCSASLRPGHRPRASQQGGSGIAPRTSPPWAVFWLRRPDL